MVVVEARRAVAADLDAIAGLAGAFLAEMRPVRGGRLWAERDAPKPPFAPEIGDAIADPAGLVLVGTVDTVVVGYCITRIDTLSTGTRLGCLTALFVDAEAREVGVGEAMLDRVVEWCRDEGCVGVDSVVLPGLRASKNFFETAGFMARAIVVHHTLEPGAG